MPPAALLDAFDGEPNEVCPLIRLLWFGIAPAVVHNITNQEI